MGEKIVEVPGFGNVSFPDSMADDQISSVIQKQVSDSQIRAAQAAKYPTAAEGGNPNPQFPWYSRYFSNEGLGTAQKVVNAFNNTAPTAKTGLEPTGNRVLDFARGALQSGVAGAPETSGMGLAESVKASPLGYAASSVAEGATSALDRLKGMIPSTERSGANLQKIKTAAANVPVDISSAAKIADESKGITATGGGSPPTPMAKFIQRTKPVVSNINGEPTVLEREPVNYPESFDFASNAKDLLRDLKASGPNAPVKAAMQRSLKQFTNALSTGNRAAAEQVGLGDLYDSAMKEYRQAKTIEDATASAKKWAIRGAIGYAGLKTAQQIFGTKAIDETLASIKGAIVGH